MRRWFRNVFDAVVTVAQALRVCMRYWVRTYDPHRLTFTEHYEYPELPLQVSPRFRGFHRYNLTVCIACERCARECPANCIYVGKERVAGRKGFQVTSFTIDYGKCMFCAICTEGCSVGGLRMGSSYDLSCRSREGAVVDFAKLPRQIAWGQGTLNAAVVANAKVITKPVHYEPNG